MLCKFSFHYFSNSAFDQNRPQIELIRLIFTDFSSENQRKSENICLICQICGLFGSYAELLSLFPYMLRLIFM
jgi:hypothetical protein